MMTALKQFLREARGNVAIFFALSILPAVILMGGVIDYTNVLNSKAKLQGALDNSLLGAVAAMDPPPDPEDDPGGFAEYKTEVREKVLDWLQQNLVNADNRTLELKDLQISVDTEGTVTANVFAGQDTTFLRFVSIDTFDIAVSSQVKRQFSGVTEVVLALDNTGSMWGSKLAELKTASGQLLDVLLAKVNDSGGKSEIKVGIVPFTSYVNVGPSHLSGLWLDGGDWSGGGTSTVCAYKRFFWFGWRESCREISWPGVVGTRAAPNNTTDDNYGLDKVPAIPNIFHTHLDDDLGVQKRWGSTPTEVQPLISLNNTTRTQLQNKINAMTANGWTYIPAGLVWAWRVLSSKAPFTEGASPEDVREKGVRKIVVLMTDGFNTCRPAENGLLHCGVAGDEADTVLAQACENIKAIDPESGQPYADVITVTFDLGESPKEKKIKKLMSDCATMGTYDAKSGELVEVFKDIGQKLTKLHLSR